MSPTSAFSLSPTVSERKTGPERTATPVAPRRRILWIKADPLYPLDSGGKIRTFQMLKEWRRLHDITYVSLFPAGTPEEAKQHARNYSSEQAWVPWRDKPKRTFGFYLDLLKNLFFSRLPYVIDKYHSAEAVRTLRRLQQEKPFDLIVADFPSMAMNIFEAGLDTRRGVIFQHNVESQIWRRHHEAARHPLMKAYMRLQWQRFARFEPEVCRRFGGVIAVSRDDAERFRTEFGLTNVLGDVATGVDVDFFGAVPRAPKPADLVFLGSMDWMPNVDGIVDFVRTTFPAIKARRADATLTIVGRNPAPAVLALAAQDPSIRVTGTVPDVRPYMAQAALSIVPLRVGGGTRIKIFEAMAMGVPVVSTTIGAEGLPVTDGHDIVIADDAEAFANRVAELLDNPARARGIGEAGQTLVRERFSWRNAVAEFDRMCMQAIAAQ